MKREEIIRNLEYTMEKHKNNTVDTFGTNISLMCKDILDYLEQEQCDDAISRQSVLALAKEECDTAIIPYRKFVKDVNALSPVTPRPKTGRWVDGDSICPCCGKDKYEDLDADIYADWQPRFCPNCGAKMESEVSEYGSN